MMKDWTGNKKSVHGGTLCRNGGDAAIKVVGNRYDNPELIKVRKV